MEIITKPTALIAVCCSFLMQVASAEPLGKVKNAEQVDDIKAALEEVVAEEGIPGMIAAIISSKGIEAVASDGIRKIGSEQRLSENDLVHLGSCTKAMTSMLMGGLVAEKIITWETRVIDVFPELKGDIHRDYHDVTLWQLLTHRSRVPANAKSWWKYRGLPLRERRIALLKENLKDPPIVNRGGYLYSNLGYMIAGCMAEKLTDSTWEALIQKRLFNPLKMNSAGFGSPGTLKMVDQPWGHQRSSGKWQAKQFDNAEALGPAGRVHCTIEDWAKFISMQLPGREGKEVILNQEGLQKLITPNGKYAGGWFVTNRRWGSGLVLNHAGSNTMWYAVVWVAPNIDRAYIVVTNSYDKKSGEICDKMVSKLIEIDNQ